MKSITCGIMRRRRYQEPTDKNCTFEKMTTPLKLANKKRFSPNRIMSEKEEKLMITIFVFFHRLTSSFAGNLSFVCRQVSVFCCRKVSVFSGKNDCFRSFLLFVAGKKKRFRWSRNFVAGLAGNAAKASNGRFPCRCRFFAVAVPNPGLH